MSVLFLVAMAHASSTYPADVQSDLGMPCAPQCTLCHTSNVGGAGTVTQPFGVAMMDRGLTGGGRASLLTAALDAMATDAIDSDGDGVADVDELADGGNPNDDTVFCDVVTPSYGCLNTAASAWTLTGAIVAAFALRRRR